MTASSLIRLLLIYYCHLTRCNYCASMYASIDLEGAQSCCGLVLFQLIWGLNRLLAPMVRLIDCLLKTVKASAVNHWMISPSSVCLLVSLLLWCVFVYLGEQIPFQKATVCYAVSAVSPFSWMQPLLDPQRIRNRYFMPHVVNTALIQNESPNVPGDDESLVTDFFT